MTEAPTELHTEGQQLLVDFVAMTDALRKNSDKPRDVINSVAERLNRRILENKATLKRLGELHSEAKELTDKVNANLALNYADFLTVLRSAE